jgi:YYY domain-containing protein
MLAVLLWLAAVQALALAILPLTIRVFRPLPDRGYGLSKILGSTLVGYAAWLLSMLGFVSYTRPTVIVLSVATGVACWWVWGRACLGQLRLRWRLLATLEASFLLVLAAATFVRAYNPDIVGQEKFMDLALMNTFLTAPDLPAEDPWLSGFGVPYYYLGYLIVGLAARIAGTPPPIAYNLAVALVFATAFLGALVIVYAVVASVRANPPGRVDRTALAFGLLGAALVMLVGNLEAPLELLAARGWGDPGFWQAVGVKGLAANPSGGWLPVDGSWWWRASRVIPNIQPDGITEFPYFSFLLGDLHPHYMALSLDLAVVGLALAAWLDDRSPYDLPSSLVAAVTLAVLVAANTWDVPTFWALLLGASGLALWRHGGWRGRPPAALARAAAPFLCAPLAVAPYFVGYQSQPLGVGWVDERTPLPSLLILFGPALLLALLFAAWSLVRHGDSRLSFRGTGPRAVAGVVLLVVALIAVVEPTLALLGLAGTLVALAFRRWFRMDAEGGRPLASAALFCAWLALVALGILTTVELVYLRDLFGTRMNSVFKFHYNAWLLLALAGAAALGLIWAEPARDRRGTSWRWAVALLAVVALVPGSVYPLAATWTKSERFIGEPTLDGARFLRRRSPADWEAIQWLRANAAGRPVVVEAVGPDYGEHARVSTFSGLPTVVGWIGHELQWRGDQPEYGRRQSDVDAIYRAETPDELTARAGPYRARYLFFGSLERERYGANAERRLSGLLPVAFVRGGTVVYLLPAATEERPP